MEKLKCSSCGGDIVVEDNKEYGTCPHCGTRYKLNQDVNFNFRLDDNTKEVLSSGAKHVSKFMFIPIIMFFAIFCVIAFNVFRFSRSNSNFNEEQAERNKENDKSSFNFQFLYDNGTKSAFLMGGILDDVIQSNKTHDRKVVLVFNGNETTDEAEIIDIKHSLSGDYEVSLNYDDDGYINKVIVDKIEKSDGGVDSSVSNKIDEVQGYVSDEVISKMEEMQEYMNSDEYKAKIQEAHDKVQSILGN